MSAATLPSPRWCERQVCGEVGQVSVLWPQSGECSPLVPSPRNRFTTPLDSFGEKVRMRAKICSQDHLAGSGSLTPSLSRNVVAISGESWLGRGGQKMPAASPQEFSTHFRDAHTCDLGRRFKPCEIPRISAIIKVPPGLLSSPPFLPPVIDRGLKECVCFCSSRCWSSCRRCCAPRNATA